MILLLATLALGQSTRELQVLDELDRVEIELQETSEELRTLQAEQAEMDAQIEAGQAELDEIQATLDGSADQVTGLVRAVYHLNRRGFARILFSAEDPSDLRRRSRYLMAILAEFDQVVTTYQAQMGDKQTALERLETDRKAISELTKSLSENVLELEAQRSERQELLDEVRSDDRLLRMATSRREEGAITLSQNDYEAPRPASGQRFRDLQGKLSRPVQSSSVLKGYGTTQDPISGQRTKNRGVTLACSLHAPVRTVADGQVVRASHVGRGYGMTVQVDHGDGYTTTYANLGQIKVRQGQDVRKGDYLGTCGETGVTDMEGPRVHFEVRYQNSDQDPANWLAP